MKLYNQTRNYWIASRAIRLGNGDVPLAHSAMMYLALNAVSADLRRAAMNVCLQHGVGMGGMVLEGGAV